MKRSSLFRAGAMLVLMFCAVAAARAAAPARVRTAADVQAMINKADDLISTLQAQVPSAAARAPKTQAVVVAPDRVKQVRVASSPDTALSRHIEKATRLLEHARRRLAARTDPHTIQNAYREARRALVSLERASTRFTEGGE